MRETKAQSYDLLPGLQISSVIFSYWHWYPCFSLMKDPCAVAHEASEKFKSNKKTNQHADHRTDNETQPQIRLMFGRE